MELKAFLNNNEFKEEILIFIQENFLVDETLYPNGIKYEYDSNTGLLCPILVDNNAFLLEMSLEKKYKHFKKIGLPRQFIKIISDLAFVSIHDIDGICEYVCDKLEKISITTTYSDLEKSVNKFFLKILKSIYPTKIVNCSCCNNTYNKQSFSFLDSYLHLLENIDFYSPSLFQDELNKLRSQIIHIIVGLERKFIHQNYYESYCSKNLKQTYILIHVLKFIEVIFNENDENLFLKAIEAKKPPFTFYSKIPASQIKLFDKAFFESFSIFEENLYCL